MSCCRRQYAGTRPWSLNNAYERGTRCRRRAIAPPRGRRQLGIRAGACPVAAANPSALAPCPSITIHTSYVYHTHVLQMLCQCTRSPSTMTGNTSRCMSCSRRQCACTCPSCLNTRTFLPYSDRHMLQTRCQCTSHQLTMIGSACRGMSCCRRRCAGTYPSPLNSDTYVPRGEIYVLPPVCQRTSEQTTTI